MYEQINPTSEEYRTDGFKIAIAIEGGGMRGCVAAGMVSVSLLRGQIKGDYYDNSSLN